MDGLADTTEDRLLALATELGEQGERLMFFANNYFNALNAVAQRLEVIRAYHQDGDLVMTSADEALAAIYRAFDAEFP